MSTPSSRLTGRVLPGSPEPATCLLCGSTTILTDEHIIPAALGGEDVVKNATCPTCNGRCSELFEAEFTNGFKTVCYLLGVGNRQGKVPSIDAVTVIDGREFEVILQPGGSFRLVNKKEERVLPTGGKVTEYFLFSGSEKKTLELRAAKRGERLEGVEGDGRPIEFEPESFMPLDFIGADSGLRTATKVAFMVAAKVAGGTFANSAAFDEVRRYLLKGEPCITRLFVNTDFASNIHVGPHQHAVQVYCDGKKRTVFATVTFFGGLTYLVQLSGTYDGADYGFTYGYDSLNRKATPVLVQNFETERLAIEDVLNGRTEFDNLKTIADHWATYIQSAAREVISPATRDIAESR